MIEYVYESNIDQRIIDKAVRALKAGQLIALPTDASWTIACSLASKEGIKRLRQAAGARDERLFTLLCSSISQISEVCSLDNSRFRLVKRLTPGPYVFILRSLLGTERILNNKRQEVGVRIPGHRVALAVVDTLGSPLYSITAKRTMTEDPTNPPFDETFPLIPEEDLFEGGWELEVLDGIALILDDGQERPRHLSTVLDLGGDTVVLLRLGAGSWPL